VRFRTLLIAIALTVLATGIVAGPATAATSDSSLSKLKQQVRDAIQQRDRARVRARAAAANLAGARQLHAATSVLAADATADMTTVQIIPPTMDPALAAVLLADGIVTVEEVAAQQARSAKANTVARRWTIKVRRLSQQVRRLQQIATWNRRGQWRPLIEIAGKKYGVSPAGLYRMMMLESGGRRTVGGMY
jgi:soluble lytic murein transglycosylase-like protein